MSDQALTVNSPLGYEVTSYREIRVAGPEDITIDPATGMAFISSQERRPLSGDRDVQGAIYGLDLKKAIQNEALEPVKLTGDLPAGMAFHPHGISLYRGADGRNRLFAINHRSAAEHFVEIFDVEATGTLRHADSITDPQFFTSPNDLVAVGPEQFFLTNDHAEGFSWLKTIEDALRVPRGNVVYYDKTLTDKTFTRVAEGIGAANGIAADPARRRLYVSATLWREVLVYAWDPAQPSRPLERIDAISLGSAPDNLEWDAAGTLWIGAHPSLNALTLHILGFRSKAPSHVLRLHLPADGSGPSTIEDVFRDDGSKVSASSVAAFYGTETGGYLLIGAPWDDHLLLCSLTTR